jgi:hypothetical protein
MVTDDSETFREDKLDSEVDGLSLYSTYVRECDKGYLTGPIAFKVNRKLKCTVGTDNRKQKLWEKNLYRCELDYNKFYVE